MAHVAVEKQDIKRRVEHEKSPQQVSLIPKRPFQEPVQRIFERIPDVVKVNDYARLQPGQNFKKDVVDVTANLADVRRVNEQEVVFLQAREEP